MEDIDSTNGRLARVLSDIDQLIAWAEADREASYAAHANDQAEHHARNVSLLHMAKHTLKGI